MIKIHMYSTATWLKALTGRFILILGFLLHLNDGWFLIQSGHTVIMPMCMANFHWDKDVTMIELTRRGIMFQSEINFFCCFSCVFYAGNCQNVIRQRLPNLSQRLKLIPKLIIVFDFKIYFSAKCSLLNSKYCFTTRIFPEQK